MKIYGLDLKNNDRLSVKNILGGHTVLGLSCFLFIIQKSRISFETSYSELWADMIIELIKHLKFPHSPLTVLFDSDKK